jgi:hypothetical protein
VEEGKYRCHTFYRRIGGIRISPYRSDLLKGLTIILSDNDWNNIPFSFNSLNRLVMLLNSYQKLSNNTHGGYLLLAGRNNSLVNHWGYSGEIHEGTGKIKGRVIQGNHPEPL